MKPTAETEIVKAIEAYLSAHPDAADAVEGIRSFWLPRHVNVTNAQVQAALERLESRGVVHRTLLANGTSVYRAARVRG